MPPEHLGKLACPRCGALVSEGGEIRLVETIECARRIRRVKDGRLVVNSWYETDGYDDGKNPQFECQSNDAHGHTCGHLWCVPDWIKPLIDRA